MVATPTMKSDRDPEGRHTQELYNDNIDKIRDAEYPQLHGDGGSFQTD